MNTKNLILALSFAVGSLSAPLAQAHAKIEAADPKAESELTAAPREVKLRFNEALEPAFSKIELIDSKNASLKLQKVAFDKADRKVMSVPLPALGKGQYRVRWSTMTHDGHKAKGEYRFKVK